MTSERVGLDPDASNAFLMVSPYTREATREIASWGKAARWVFAPYGPYPSRFWRLAPWRFFSLGCRGVNSTPTLDTCAGYSINRTLRNSTEVPVIPRYHKLRLSRTSVAVPSRHSGVCYGRNLQGNRHGLRRALAIHGFRENATLHPVRLLYCPS